MASNPGGVRRHRYASANVSVMLNAGNVRVERRVYIDRPMRKGMLVKNPASLLLFVLSLTLHAQTKSESPEVYKFAHEDECGSPIMESQLFQMVSARCSKLRHLPS